MPSLRLARVAGILAAGLALAACGTTLPRLVSPGAQARKYTIPPPPPGGFDLDRPYPLLPGDRIEIVVLDDTRLNAQLQIPPDGSLEIWQSEKVADGDREKVQVKGKTTAELADAIAEIYGRVKFQSRPYVQVNVTEAVERVVLVLGAVKSPQTAVNLPKTGRMTLYRAIMAAGGPDENADLTQVRVSRKDPATGADVSLPLYDVEEMSRTAAFDRDPPLEPNDIVTVPALGWITIFGNISAPGKYLCEPDMTILRLFAVAGGPKPFSKTHEVRVIRGEGEATEKTYYVDVQKILDNEAPDARLLPGDRLWIDEDWK